MARKLSKNMGTPSDEIILEEFRRWYDGIFPKVHDVNTKSGILLAFIGAALVLLIGEIEIFDNLLNKLWDGTWWLQVLAIFDGFMLLASIVLIMVTLLCFSYYYPNSSTFKEEVDIKKRKTKKFRFIDDYNKVSRDFFMEKLLKNYPNEVCKAWSRSRTKKMLYNISLCCTLIFLILLLLVFILIYTPSSENVIKHVTIPK